MSATTSDASTERLVLPCTAPRHEPSGPDGAADAGRPQDSAERARLIELCLYAVDRARSTGVAERLTLGLAEVGVVALRPDGAWFDPARHEAAGTVETTDPALDGVILGTEVPGFADRERVLRAPVVTVYRLRR
ncbi:nucleotide exchange factor GrpE [Bounagaea algeriensis]